MRICFDFDGVLHDPSNRDLGYRMGKPFVGAVEYCTQLTQQGHDLVIHTARVQKLEDEQHVYQWLRYFGFPFMRVMPFKPLADVYVDNRALRFDGDWSHLVYALYTLEHGAARASDQAGQQARVDPYGGRGHINDN